ncbi:MAG: sodium:solute symporter family protein [Bacteroidota bacterium]
MVDIVNIVLVIVYFAVILTIGFRAKGNKKNEQDFFLANRNVGFLALTATLVASMIGGNGLISMMSFVYQYGLSTLWVPFGLLLGFLVTVIFAPKIKKLSDENGFYTLPDFIHNKYGKSAGISTASILFLIYIGYFLTQFIAGGVILSTITGWSYAFSVVLMGAVVTLYITASGFNAVIKTDIVQYFILLLLVVLSLSLFANSGEIDPKNLSLMAANPVDIITFLVYGLVVITIGAEVWQRIYAAKDIKTIKKSLIWSGVFTVIIFSFIVLMGLFAQTRFPDAVPEKALALGFSSLLPNYLKGIGLVVLFAAIMSSLDTFLFVLSTSVSKDFISKSKRLSQYKFVTNPQVISVVIGIIGIVLALILDSIVSVLLSVAGIYFVLFAPIIFSFRFNLKKEAVILSLIGGVLVSILAFIILGITTETALLSFPASFVLLGIGQLIFRK